MTSRNFTSIANRA